MFDTLVKKNLHFTLLPVTDKSFRQYGRIVEEIDFSPWLQIMRQIPVPETGNIYVADEPRLSSSPPAEQVCRGLYGAMPVQVGYCNGNGSRLNALEYHKTFELNIAATDLVLLLADARDIRENTLQTEQVTGYYVPAGTACELYGTTLHFAPCKVSDKGFQCIVVLPRGINLPLSQLPQNPVKEEQLLWMQGKWLLAHAESEEAANGAYVGLVGKNLQVHPLIN